MVSDDTAGQVGTDRRAPTIPFPLDAIFRYLYLVHQKHGEGIPARCC
jgi:hypothetical protein